jgi:hypothetical protein
MILVSEVFDANGNRVRRFENADSLKLEIGVHEVHAREKEENVDLDALAYSVYKWYWASIGVNSLGKTEVGFEYNWI